MKSVVARGKRVRHGDGVHRKAALLSLILNNRIEIELSKISVDITIPVLNEEHSLPHCISTLTEHLCQRTWQVTGIGT